VVRPSKETAHSYYQQALFHEYRKRYTLAIEYFEKVISIDPNYVAAYNGMGVTYDLLENFPRAAEYYQKAIALAPNLDYVQNNLGYSCYLQGKTESAIEAFKKAIVLNAKESRYHNNLGLAYAEIGLYEEAFEEFKKAGSEADAYYNLGKFFYGRGAHEAASRYFIKALALTSESMKSAGIPSLPHIQLPVITADNSSLTDYAKDAGTMDDIESQHHKTISTAALQQTESKIDNVLKDKAAMELEAKACTVKCMALDCDQKKSDNDVQEYLCARKSDTEIFAASEKKGDIEEQQKKTLLDRVNGTSDFAIEISNGNGMSNMAREMGNYLRRKDSYKNVYITNAEHFYMNQTIIYYMRGYLRNAYRIAQSIPGWQDIVEIERFARSEIKIRVLVGKDVIPYSSIFDVCAQKNAPCDTPIRS